jgi:tRNA threonylcarbamoyladenosine biosynthesis protein TsaE
MTGPPVTLEVDARSVEETKRIGAALAPLLAPGDVVLLVGELGAGKTTLTKAIVEALGATGVTSPTFTLCHRYDTAPPVAHVDCYRIVDGDNLADLALDEVLDDGYVAIVEWGERLGARFGNEALECTLSYGVDDQVGLRRVKFLARGTSWSTRVDSLIERVTKALAGAPSVHR